jgi:GTP-binding protein
MEPDGKGRARLEYLIPGRGTDRLPDRIPHDHRRHRPLVPRVRSLRTASPKADRQAPERRDDLERQGHGAGVRAGQPAGTRPPAVTEGDEIYEGQLVGIHAKDNDLTVNALRAKQLTNIRAAGKDDNVQLTPPIRMSLEQALEFIEDDELVEVTPKGIRLRKKHLTENDRKKASRQAA